MIHTLLLSLLLQLSRPRPAAHPHDHPLCLPDECFLVQQAPTRLLGGQAVCATWIFPEADGMDSARTGFATPDSTGSVEITEPVWTSSGAEWHIVGALRTVSITWIAAGGKSVTLLVYVQVQLDPRLPNGGAHDLAAEMAAGTVTQ